MSFDREIPPAPELPVSTSFIGLSPLLFAVKHGYSMSILPDGEWLMGDGGVQKFILESYVIEVAYEDHDGSIYSTLRTSMLDYRFEREVGRCVLAVARERGDHVDVESKTMLMRRLHRVPEARENGEGGPNH